MRPISDCHLTAQISTTSLGANSPKASSRLSGGSDDPHCLWFSHTDTQTVAHRDVQPESLKKYGLVITCLISFIFWCFEGWECGYSMELTSGQKEGCPRLKDILVELWTSDIQEVIGPEDDWFSDDKLEDLEDSDGEDECLELDKGKSTETQSSPPNLVENSVQRCILDLLISLFTHLPSGSDDKFYSPIHRFLVLFSLKANGQWLAGRRITQLFAALLFCGRQVIMALMHDCIVERDIHYFEWVSD